MTMKKTLGLLGILGVLTIGNMGKDLVKENKEITFTNAIQTMVEPTRQEANRILGKLHRERKEERVALEEGTQLGEPSRQEANRILKKLHRERNQNRMV